MNVKKIFAKYRYWVGALLVLALISACGGTPTEVPPTAQPTLVPTEPPAAPTETPTPPPTATAVPEVTAEAESDLEPLSPAVCSDLANAMAQTLGVEVATAEAPFQDYISGKAGTGCQATAKGTGLDFENFVVVADALREMLRYQGWQEDSMYAADGPTGTGTGFQRAGELCLLTVGWEPSADADCPQDQPISACQLAPEQQLYTIELNCAQDATAAELRSIIAASLPPTPIETLESAAHIADEEGLQYVYIGNYPGHERNSTFCPECGEKIIERVHFAVLSLNVEKGKCRFCGHSIPGVWRDA